MVTSDEDNRRPSSSTNVFESPEKYRSRKASSLQYRSYRRKNITAAHDACESSSEEEAFDSPNKYSTKRRRYSISKATLYRSETNAAGIDSSETEISDFESISESQNGTLVNSESSNVIFDSCAYAGQNAANSWESDQPTSSDTEIKNQNKKSSTESDSDSRSNSDDDDDETSSSTNSETLQDSDEDETCLFEKPLYNDANITVGASSVLILQFCQKYKLPQKARNDLINLVRQHCPINAELRIPKRYGKMLSLVMPVLQKVEKQTVCAVCNTLIPSNSTLCENQHAETRVGQDNPYFYNIPLEPQLKLLLEGNN